MRLASGCTLHPLTSAFVSPSPDTTRDGDKGYLVTGSLLSAGKGDRRGKGAVFSGVFDWRRGRRARTVDRIHQASVRLPGEVNLGPWGSSLKGKGIRRHGPADDQPLAARNLHRPAAAATFEDGLNNFAWHDINGLAAGSRTAQRQSHGLRTHA